MATMIEYPIESVYIEITDRCNLNCTSCYNADSRQHTEREMPVEALRQSVEAISRLGCRRIVLSGGEPTLHSRFEEILSFIAFRQDIRWGIATNGVDFPASLGTLAANAANLDFQVSLDGSSEEVNSLTRGKGSFEKTWACLQRLAAVTDKVSCKMVISRFNKGDIEAFYEKVTALGVKPEFGFVLRQGNAESNWEDIALSPLEKEEAINRIDALNQRYHQSAGLPVCTFRCPYAGEPASPTPLSLLVKVDGAIQPCQSLYEEAYSVGTLLQFEPALFAEKVEKFSKMARARTAIDFGCKNCIARSRCQKGCPAAALSISGDFYGDDGDCPLRRRQAVKALISQRGGARK